MPVVVVFPFVPVTATYGTSHSARAELHLAPHGEPAGPGPAEDRRALGHPGTGHDQGRRRRGAPARARRAGARPRASRSRVAASPKTRSVASSVTRTSAPSATMTSATATAGHAGADHDDPLPRERARSIRALLAR